MLKLLFRSGVKGRGGKCACGAFVAVAELVLVDALERSLLLLAHGRRRMRVERIGAGFMVLVAWLCWAYIDENEV